jgi:hypothetical protein
MEGLGSITGLAGAGDRSIYFHPGNLDRIKDAPPNASATVHCDDVMTMSELARRGFHLVDMSEEVWLLRRAG